MRVYVLLHGREVSFPWTESGQCPVGKYTQDPSEAAQKWSSRPLKGRRIHSVSIFLILFYLIKKKKKALYFAICFLSFLTKIQKEACSVSLAFFSIPEVDCLSLVEKGPKCNMVTVCYQVCQTYHAAFLLGSAAASCWYGLAALCMDQSRLTQGRRDLLPALGCEILFISLQLQPYPALQRSSRQPGEFLSARACGVLPNLPPIYAFWDLIFLQWRHSLMMALRYVRDDDWDKTCMQITKEIMVMHCSFLRRS